MKTYYVAYEGTKNNPTAILLCYKTSPLGNAEWVCRKQVSSLEAYKANEIEFKSSAEWLQKQHNERYNQLTK